MAVFAYKDEKSFLDVMGIEFVARAKANCRSRTLIVASENKGRASWHPTDNGRKMFSYSGGEPDYGRKITIQTFTFGRHVFEWGNSI